MKIGTMIYGKTGHRIIKELHKRWVASGGPGIFYASGIASEVKIEPNNEVVFECDDCRGTIFEEGQDRMRKYLARYLQNNVLIGLDLTFSWYGALPSDMSETVQLREGGAKFKAGDLVALKAYLEGDERQKSLFGENTREKVEGEQADPVETELNSMIEQEKARIEAEFKAARASLKRGDSAALAAAREKRNKALDELKALKRA